LLGWARDSQVNLEARSDPNGNGAGIADADTHADADGSIVFVGIRPATGRPQRHGTRQRLPRDWPSTKAFGRRFVTVVIKRGLRAILCRKRG
jgi:hypothetical protein